MASTDARPLPRKNIAYRATFPIWTSAGALLAGAGSLDSEVSIDGGTFSDATSEATEIATSSGVYYLDLTSGEMNGDTVAIKITSATGLTTVIVLYPEEAGDVRADVVQWLGTACATPTVAGVPEVDLTHMSGDATSAADLKDFADAGYDPATNKVQGVVLVDTATSVTTVASVTSLAAGAITSTTYAAGAITSTTFAAGAITATAFASSAITSSVLAGGAITNAVIATDAIGALELATSAVTEIVDAVWAATTRTLTAGTNIVLTKGTGVTGFNDLSAAQVNAEVDTALVDIHLDHLLAVDYDPTSKPGVATALLNELIESDAGVSRYTANALEMAPSGGGGGGDGSTFTAIPWNVAWDAEVQSEVADALIAYRLDELLTADADIEGAAPPVSGSVFFELMSKPGTFSWSQATDSLEAMRDAAVTEHNTTQAALLALDAVLDKLDTTLEADGAVYRYTINALEQAPAGGGGSSTVEIQRNTDYGPFAFLMVDSAGTPLEGLDVACSVMLDGAAFVGTTTPTATEVSDGWYYVDLVAADLDGKDVVFRAEAEAQNAVTLSIKLVTQG